MKNVPETKESEFRRTIERELLDVSNRLQAKLQEVFAEAKGEKQVEASEKKTQGDKVAQVSSTGARTQPAEKIVYVSEPPARERRSTIRDSAAFQMESMKTTRFKRTFHTYGILRQPTARLSQAAKVDANKTRDSLGFALSDSYTPLHETYALAEGGESRDLAASTDPGISPRTDEDEPPKTPFELFSDFVQSPPFDAVAGGVLIANAAYLGFETDYMARHELLVLPSHYKLVDSCFCVFFTLELMLRICALRSSFFYTEQGNLSFLSVFDFFIVGAQISNEVDHFLSLNLVKNNRAFTVLRTLRVVRLLRFIRTAKSINFFAPLRTMLISIADSSKFFLFAMSVLSSMCFMLAVCLTQAATDSIVNGDTESEELAELKHFFGSLERSFLTLYWVISDGIHWSEILLPLRKNCPPWVTMTFVLYVSFSVFVMMNIITSSFVESALRAAEEDTSRELMGVINTVMYKADEDNSGTLSWDEMEKHLMDRDMQTLLKAIDVGEDEAKTLFRILDLDGTGEIPIDEFTSGCLRLKGTAKAVDLAAFMHDLEGLCTRFVEHNVAVTASLDTLETNLQALADRMDEAPNR